MKKLLFTTTALAGLAFGGVASAQGVSVFGDARLGLGYNIDGDGDPTGEDELRAVSRVRFGVNLTGESDSGITFGATIRADNAEGGEAASQSDGNVFVSGAFGTLTLGDTNGADEQHVGDVPGNLSLTGLGDLNEGPFLSNGGDFGGAATDFLEDPEARPTIRYDLDFASFGFSVSSDRDLDDVEVGASYSGSFGDTSFSIGAGYNDFASFTIPGEEGTTTATIDTDGDTIPDTDVVVPIAAVDTVAEGGEQFSVGAFANFFGIDAGITYLDADSDGDASFSFLSVGGEYTFDLISVGAYYATFLEAEGGVEDADGEDSFGLTASYDLGGGASLRTGVVQTFGFGDEDDETVADFGISMSF